MSADVPKLVQNRHINFESNPSDRRANRRIMSYMNHKVTDGAMKYVDEQIEALKEYVPRALHAFDPVGVHQARVATRRLKAALDLFKPFVDPKDMDGLVQAGKKLRRRLGPLRDLDVMIQHLGSYEAPIRLKPAVEWVLGQFEHMRVRAREKDRRKGKSPEKILSAFDEWWKVRHKLQDFCEAISVELSTRLHEQFDRFSSEADIVCGLVPTPLDQPPVDLHQLRIDGKSLRYTFEMASVQGIRVRKSVLRSFKSMQEALGLWHDKVVLADETVKRWAKVELALHDPEAATVVLDLGKQFLQESRQSFKQFITRWKRSREMIRRELQTRVPLTRNVSDNARGVVDDVSDPSRSPETDPDRPEQGLPADQKNPVSVFRTTDVT